MSILKYFKYAPAIQDEELPESGSCLSNVVPLKAIEMANAEVYPVTVHLIIPPRLINIDKLTIFVKEHGQQPVARDLSLSSWLQPVDCKTCLFLVCKSIPLH